MKSDRTAIIGGVLILIGGITLAIYANINAQALTDAKAKTVNTYISLSEKALVKGEQRNAEKFALKALTADPTNKDAVSNFKATYVPPVAVNSTTTEKPTNQPQKPAPQEDAEEEMGCI